MIFSNKLQKQNTAEESQLLAAASNTSRHSSKPQLISCAAASGGAANTNGEQTMAAPWQNKARRKKLRLAFMKNDTQKLHLRLMYLTGVDLHVHLYSYMYPNA
jgi:hypothetical protein